MLAGNQRWRRSPAVGHHCPPRTVSSPNHGLAAPSSWTIPGLIISSKPQADLTFSNLPELCIFCVKDWSLQSPLKDQGEDSDLNASSCSQTSDQEEGNSM